MSRGAQGAVPALPERAIWINGRVVRGAEAALSLFDRGARDGGGLFETLRVYEGRPFLWHRHLERMVLAAAELGFPVPPSPTLLAAALAELLAAESLTEASARITVTRGIAGIRPGRPGAWIEVEPIAGRLWRGARAGAARVIVSRHAFAPGRLGRYKTTSRLAYHLAYDEARAARVDEALIQSPSGELLEGSASNVFLVIAGELVTPPLDSEILPGITRTLVLELCRELGIPVRERPLATAELAHASELFLTNSLQEIVPVRFVAGRELPEPQLAPRLLAAYREAVARAIHAE